MKVGNQTFVKLEAKIINLAYGSYEATSTSSMKSEQSSQVEIPTTLFNTISLEYILKRNLTEILNGMLKKVSVVLGPEDLQPKPKESLSEIISFLPSIWPNMTSRQLEIMQNSATNNKRSWLKKISNILFNQAIGFPSTNDNIYALDEGQIIVHDCKSYIFQCQYEGTILVSRLSI